MIHDLAESLFKNSVFAFNGIQYRISSITPLSQKDNWDPFSPIYTDPKGLLVQFEFHSSGETTEMKTRDENWTPDPGENHELLGTDAEALNQPAKEITNQTKAAVSSPFRCRKCGAEPILRIEDHGVGGSFHWMQCSKCPNNSDRKKKISEAMDLWKKENPVPPCEVEDSSKRNKETIDRLIKKIDEMEDFITDVDGFIYFWPRVGGPGGHLAAWHLRAIADELDKRNEPWNKKIEEYFDEMLGDSPPQGNQSPPKNSHQERVIKEKRDLDEKAMRLSIFIGRSPEFANLKQEEQRRLIEQLKIMWQYAEILGKRIAGFGE